MVSRTAHSLFVVMNVEVSTLLHNVHDLVFLSGPLPIPVLSCLWGMDVVWFDDLAVGAMLELSW